MKWILVILLMLVVKRAASLPQWRWFPNTELDDSKNMVKEMSSNDIEHPYITDRRHQRSVNKEMNEERTSSSYFPFIMMDQTLFWLEETYRKDVDPREFVFSNESHQSIIDLKNIYRRTWQHLLTLMNSIETYSEIFSNAPDIVCTSSEKDDLKESVEKKYEKDPVEKSVEEENKKPLKPVRQINSIEPGSSEFKYPYATGGEFTPNVFAFLPFEQMYVQLIAQFEENYRRDIDVCGFPFPSLYEEILQSLISVEDTYRFVIHNLFEYMKHIKILALRHAKAIDSCKNITKTPHIANDEEHVTSAASTTEEMITTYFPDLVVDDKKKEKDHVKESAEENEKEYEEDMEKSVEEENKKSFKSLHQINPAEPAVSNFEYLYFTGRRHQRNISEFLSKNPSFEQKYQSLIDLENINVTYGTPHLLPLTNMFKEVRQHLFDLENSNRKMMLDVFDFLIQFLQTHATTVDLHRKTPHIVNDEEINLCARKIRYQPMTICILASTRWSILIKEKEKLRWSSIL